MAEIVSQRVGFCPRTTKVGMMDNETRFWSKVEKSDESDCWIWKTALSGSGYGRFKVGTREIASHRWAYESLVGPIPEGLVIDHLCRNRACVNPDHLEAVTQRENLHRGIGNPSKTHCPQGHPYSGDNLYLRNGRRECRECRSARVERFRAKTKAPEGALV